MSPVWRLLYFARAASVSETAARATLLMIMLHLLGAVARDSPCSDPKTLASSHQSNGIAESASALYSKHLSNWRAAVSTNPDSPVRSPSYPVMSLADAVASVHKIEGQYRASKVDREIAAKMIGYSSLSGPANKALAALAQYGLVERAGKGEMRVTPRARAILHPNDAAEKRQELHAAALEPSLFREMRERWPDMIPPEEAVISYFNRRGFNPSAIRPAARAYLQTLLYLEEEDDSDSHGRESPAGLEKGENVKPENVVQPAPQSSATVFPAIAAASAAVAERIAAAPLNKINMNIQADVVHLSATLNYRGLTMLEKKIASLKALMEPDDSEDDRIDDDDGTDEGAN